MHLFFWKAKFSYNLLFYWNMNIELPVNSFLLNHKPLNNEEGRSLVRETVEVGNHNSWLNCLEYYL